MKKFEVNDFSAEELDKMSVEELEKHIQGIYEIRQVLAIEQRQAQEVLSRKSEEAEIMIRHKIADLPEEKRKAVLQILKGDNIKKEESVRNGGQE